MKQSDYKNAQPLRELAWLASYFEDHGREDLAQQIFQQIRLLRQRAQNSLTNDASDVVDFRDTKRIAD